MLFRRRRFLSKVISKVENFFFIIERIKRVQDVHLKFDSTRFGFDGVREHIPLQLRILKVLGDTGTLLGEMRGILDSCVPSGLDIADHWLPRHFGSWRAAILLVGVGISTTILVVRVVLRCAVSTPGYRGFTRSIGSICCTIRG